MGDNNDEASVAVNDAIESVNRKRSISAGAPAPPAKVAKTHNTHLQINYLARQYSDILPLVSGENDTMPSIIQTLLDYQQVLDRHESLAGNLGARPLGPILIKSFERMFSEPPRVLKSHGKEGTTVTWLDVVEFARHKPEQFNLEKTREGVRVCQFYTKQSRVEISEDDFNLIEVGMPQRVIPPQPIPEDEEKELGTLEIMEKTLAQVIQLADLVSGRARQTKHRLTARKNAIGSRRDAEAAEATPADSNGNGNSIDRVGNSSPSGFTAVNSSSKKDGPSALSNGKSYTGPSASPSTKNDLMRCFAQQRAAIDTGDRMPVSTPRTHSAAKSKPKTTEQPVDYAGILLNSASPVPIPNTPSSLVNYPRPTAQERYDDSGPYKTEMLSRMDSMQRGDRVVPPCDRCRRLHMDCLKNLTACLGCTKKHAKCSWKDVTDQELADNPRPAKLREDSVMSHGGDDVHSPSEANGAAVEVVHDPEQPVRDEELLGEDDSDDSDAHSTHSFLLTTAVPAASPRAPLLVPDPVRSIAPEAPTSVDSENGAAPHIPHHEHEVRESANEALRNHMGEPSHDVSGVPNPAMKAEPREPLAHRSPASTTPPKTPGSGRPVVEEGFANKWGLVENGATNGTTRM